MPQHAAPFIVAFWALSSLAIVLAVTFAPVQLHWGGRHGGAQAPMSRAGRAAFVAVICTMVGMVLAGMAGFSHAKVITGLFFAAVAAAFVTAAIDTHRWRRKLQDGQ